jgi:hypothetical protein
LARPVQLSLFPEFDRVSGAIVGDPPGVRWVDENAYMEPRARAYQSGATGARSNRLTKLPQAPYISYSTGTEVRSVRFDGLDEGTLIDRKIATARSAKFMGTVLRQSEALWQNSLTARWELPSAAEVRQASQIFSRLGVANITALLVPE